MRISSGWLKGMTLESPGGLTTRPTAAKVRAAVMNMLQPYLDGARILDLFAGSGGVGFEALSRGALSAVFVEKDRAALGALRRNAEELHRRALASGHENPSVAILARDVKTALADLESGELFDVIWADPPYRDVPAWTKVFATAAGGLLAEGGTFALESAENEAAEAAEVLGGCSMLELVKQRSYGQTTVSLWQRTPRP